MNKQKPRDTPEIVVPKGYELTDLPSLPVKIINRKKKIRKNVDFAWNPLVFFLSIYCIIF